MASKSKNTAPRPSTNASPASGQRTIDETELRRKINRFRQELGRYFVAKQPIIDLMTVAAVAQEPLLLVGPPGTAKSDLAVAFAEALGLRRAGEYFEYLLTRYTEPAELFGPIDLAALRSGHYVRRVEGKLPMARLVFLDEVFKGSSAILNLLLTLINERVFYQDGRPHRAAMEILFAATNAVPADDDLAALRDRFTLKVPCGSVQDEHFSELVDAGVQAHADRLFNRSRVPEPLATLEDFREAHELLSRRMEGESGGDGRERYRYFPEPLWGQWKRVVETLRHEDRIFISDRKLIKLFRLIRIHAWLANGGMVERNDLHLLAYAGETGEQIDLLEEKVPRLLGS